MPPSCNPPEYGPPSQTAPPPAVPGHYNTSDVFGFSAPGVAVQIQVAFRPAK
jgi:hypothetical protein